MLISIPSDVRRFLVSVSTRPAVLKADSEDTVEAEGVSKSRAKMESTGYIDSCDLYHAKYQNFQILSLHQSQEV